MIMILKVNFQAKETKQKQVNKKNRTQDNVGLNHVGTKAQTHSSECKKKLLRYRFLKAIQLAKIKRLIIHHVGE